MIFVGGQFLEGKLEGCRRVNCPRSCCDADRVEEWVNEYFLFHERMKDHLESVGIKIFFLGGRVRFTIALLVQNASF